MSTCIKKLVELNSIRIPIIFIHNYCIVTVIKGANSSALFPRKWAKTRVGNREQELSVHIASPLEAAEIFDFLLCHFFPEAPIRQLGLYDESEEAKRPAWIEDLVGNCVGTPYSLLVRDACHHHCIVAVAINEMKNIMGNLNSDDYLNKVSSNPAQIPVGRLHKAVLKVIHNHVDMFSIYETQKKMECSILAVDSRYTRQGLASKLMEYSLDIAKASGAGVIWTEALSEYTAKIASKFGFDTLKFIGYSEFVFEGDTPLANIPGHQTGRLMARKV